MSVKRFVVAALVPLMFFRPAHASPRIIVRAKSEATVTSTSVRLSDLSEVTSSSSLDDEAVIGLQRIVLSNAPAPGKTLTLSAAQIIERMTKEGVNLEQVGYVLPKVVTIRRAGRPLNETEVRAAIERWSAESAGDLAVKNLVIPKDSLVSPGDVDLRASPNGAIRNGRLDFILTAIGPSGEEGRHVVSAEVESWKEIPVASRPLGRGEIVSPNDVMLARMNVARLSGQVAEDQGKVIGLKLDQPVANGEVFKLNKLEMPSIIEAGGRVTLIYRAGLLEATATGIALEPGIAGQSLRVRNESSKKIVYGTVLDSGIVEVRP